MRSLLIRPYMLSVSPQRRVIALAILLVVTVLALYHQVGTFQFLDDYDDGSYVTNNLNVKYGIDWSTIRWAATAYYSQNWHPVTWLSHALDCQLYFLNSGRHHSMNVTLHAVDTLLLFWLLWKATGYVGRSFMVAALFALHPVNVESVAWISERKNILSALFFLLALGAYRWYAAKPRIARYLGVMVLYALGLMSKPQIITFPFILLLWDYWPLRRMFSNEDSTRDGLEAVETIPARSLAFLVLEKVPLLLLSTASAVITLQAQNTGDAMRGAMSAHPLSFRLANAAVSYGRYLLRVFWPMHLSLPYTFPRGGWEPWRIAASLVLLIAITLLVFLLRSRARYLLVGWLWFLGSLVPMIGIVQVGSQAMADRYAYLPFVGLFIMVCWGVPEFVSAIRQPNIDSVGRQDRLALPLAGASLIALVLLTIISYRQIGYWKDSLTLWSHAVAVDPDNDVAQDRLGAMLVTSGHQDRARAHFLAAMAANPSDPMIGFHVGFCEQQNGNLAKAIEYYNKVLLLTQDDILLYASLRDKTLINLSVAYKGLGDYKRAAEYYDEALSLRRQYQK